MLTRYHIHYDAIEDVSEMADGPWVRYDDIAPLIEAAREYKAAVARWRTTTDGLAREIDARRALFAVIEDD